MASHPLYAVRDYQAEVGTDTFSVPFPYISKAHVLVWVDGYPANFTWLSDNTIKLDKPLIQNATVRVKRKTPLNLRLVDFQSANMLTEKDLDTSALQLFYIQQETQDDLELGLIGNPDAVPVKGDKGDYTETRYKWSLLPPEKPDEFDPQPEGWTTDIPEKPENTSLWMIKCVKDGELGTVVIGWTEPVRITGESGRDGWGANPDSPTWPEGIQISSSDTAVMINWDTPNFQGYLHTKIYRVMWDNETEIFFNPDFEYSTGIGNFIDTKVESGQWYIYWIQHVNTNGEVSDVSDKLPIQVRTPLDIREGWIGQEQLRQDLAGRIDLIDLPEVGLVDKISGVEHLTVKLRDDVGHLDNLSATLRTDVDGLQLQTSGLSADLAIVSGNVTNLRTDVDDIALSLTGLEQRSGSWVTDSELASRDYATRSELTAYVTQTELDGTLGAYVTSTQLANANYATKTDLTAYVLDTELNTRLNSYVTSTELANADYATRDELTAYVTMTDFQTELQSYVSETELANADYATKTDLTAYVLDTELNTRLNSYVTSTELANADYATRDELTAYVTVTDFQTELQSYVSETELANADYATKTDLTAYVLGTDLNNTLSSYVTQVQLANADYATKADLTAYVTDIDFSTTLQSYVTSKELVGKDYATRTDLTAYVLQSDLDTTLSSYVTSTALAEADYATKTDLTSYVLESDLGATLNSYVTQTQLAGEGFAKSTDLTAYVKQTDLNTTLSSYVTNAQLTNADYATRDELTAYVTVTDFQTELRSYVSETELANADYATRDELTAYVTVTDFQTELQSYVSETELANADYATKTDLTAYVLQTDLDTTLNSYVTQTQLTNADYATNTSLTAYVKQKDLTTTLSSYVTDTQLADANYATRDELTAYVTTAALGQQLKSYVSETELAAADYATRTDLTAYVLQTEFDTTLNSYVTTEELANADYATNTSLTAYVKQKDLDTTLSSYVTSTQLANADYVTSDVLLSYVTDTELDQQLSSYVTSTQLANAGYAKSTDLTAYVLETDLNTQLSNYVTSTQLASYDYATREDLTSYVTTTALGQELSSYVTHTELVNADYATNTSLTAYVKQTDLNNALSNYVTSTALANENFAKSSDLTAYVQKTALNTTLKNYVTTTALAQADYAARTDLVAVTSRVGEAEQRISAVETKAQATEDEAYYSIKVDQNGRVAGFGLTSNPEGTAILFSADQIGFQNDAGSPVLPFSVRNDIVYMDNARVSTIEANTIVNVDDVEGNPKRAHLGNTFIEGTLALGKAGQIQWKDLSPEFRDRLVMRAVESTLSGGTRTASIKIADLAVGGSLYAARGGSTANPPITSGGRSSQVTIVVQQSNRDNVRPTRPQIKYTVYRKNLRTAVIENLGTRTHDGYVSQDEYGMFVIGMDAVEVIQCPLPTSGDDYEYWVTLVSKQTLYGSATITIEAREEVSSSDNLIVNTDWSSVQNKPATATRWPKWSEVTSKPSTFTPSAHGHNWSDISGAPSTATRWPTWSEVTGKPSTFTPSSHTHSWSQITGAPSTATRWPSWSEVTSKPSTFTPSAHVHDAGDITSGVIANDRLPASAKRGEISLANLQNETSSSLGFISGRRFMSALTWDNISGKPANYTPSAHGHNWSDISGAPSTATRWPSWSEVTGKPSSFTPSAHVHDAGDITSGVIANDRLPASAKRGEISLANLQNETSSSLGFISGRRFMSALTWDNVSGKPASYTPSAHTHAWSEITSKPATATRWPSWSEVTSKPSTFTPSAHSHDWSDITGAPSTATRWPTWSEVTGKPSTFTPSSHTHPWSQITGAPSTATRWPTWSEVTGKPNVALQSKVSGSVDAAGWYTIAQGSSRTHGKFTVSDQQGGRHNFVVLQATGAYGKLAISVLQGVRFGTETIRHVRIIYSTSDRTYDVYKLQVYLVNPSFTLDVIQHQDAQLNGGWSNWTLVTPVLENLPTGYAEDSTARLDNVTSTTGRNSFQEIHSRGDIYSSGSKVLSYADLKADTPPPELEGAISASWLSAGVVQANLIASGGLNVSNGGVTFSLHPAADKPIHYATDAGDDLFYISRQGGGYFSGGLAPNTVDANALTVEAKKAINPHYLGAAEEYIYEPSGGVIMATGSTRASSTFTQLRAGNKVDIAVRFADSAHTTSNNTNSEYRIDLQRRIGSGGSWVTIHSRDVTYYGWSRQTYINPETRVEEIVPAGRTHSISFGYTDEIPSTNNHITYRLLVTRLSSGTGTSGGLRLRHFNIETVAFKENELGGVLSSGIYHTCKETGFTTLTIVRSRSSSGLEIVTFPKPFLEVYGCTIGFSIPNDSHDRWHPRYENLTRTGVNIRVVDSRPNMTITVMVTGRMAV